MSRGVAQRMMLVLGFLTPAVHAALPYQGPERHEGVASCASSLCHGAIRPPANSPLAMNEYILWSHQDRHAKSYQALLSERGRAIASRLGLPAAESARVCLDCHADNVPAAQRGARFLLTDGVGCEACHGGAEHWIASHVAAKATYPEDVSHGMYPCANLGERALLCASCHVGNSDKWATHTMMAAGHPRLGFELDTYLALEPPHYTVDASYRRRKPAFNHAQTWAAGQLAFSVTELDVLQGAGLRTAGVFPELAFFSCTACHNSDLERPEGRRRSMTSLTVPGTVPLNDAYWRMSYLIARVLDPEVGARVLTLTQALQHAILESRDKLASTARDLSVALRAVQRRSLSSGWDSAQTTRVLQSVLQMGSQGEFRDYLGAEQAVMATELLLIDSGRAAQLRPQLDTLYRLLKSVDGYRSAEFIDALKSLKNAP
jgi:hypothetical protein